ncbi:hypothetical protein M9H77_07096 [Catharanthus roseus]|uniref:Uncharacterized protein n=1 Tax=Catharanthus roseus TaxID=4058 RepID=A0ACC0BU35_CATRO|nr:hypothetical protein M9H77_07096 [Catharanthus roseus]
MQPCSREMQTMNSILNQSQMTLHDLQNSHQQQNHFDPSNSQDDFLEQILISSSIPSSWPPDLSASATNSGSKPQSPWDSLPQNPLASLEDQSALLTSKLRQHQIGGAKAMMLQQQLMLSRGLAGNGLRSPTTAAGNGGLLPMPLSLNGNGGDVIDGSPFKSANPANDASVQALYNGFAGSLGQTSNQSQHFHHSQGGAMQAQNFGATAGGAAPTMTQTTASGSAGTGAAAQPRQQRVRARRGQATDPHSIAERLRRERIAERMKALQELVPNANKTDKASMLDEIIDYVKFLQLQVKVLSMSRLGGAAAVAPLVADMSSEGGGDCVQGNGRNGNGGTQAASSSNNDSMTVTEHQVAKLMEEDMGSAMQYLQGKGLCLMPISLATAISTATCRNPMTSTNHHAHNGNPLLSSSAVNGGGINGGEGGAAPSSPSMSVLTVQSATIGNVGADVSVKDATSVSKP